MSGSVDPCGIPENVSTLSNPNLQRFLVGNHLWQEHSGHNFRQFLLRGNHKAPVAYRVAGWVGRLPSFDCVFLCDTQLGCLLVHDNVIIYLFVHIKVLLLRPWECAIGPAYECFSCASKPTYDDDECQCPCGNVECGIPRGFSDILQAFNLIAYAFGGHGLYPETLREMRTPQQWPWVMVVTYAAVVPLYLACGLLGFIAYGTFANANINLNWPNNSANKLSIVANMRNVAFTMLISQLVQVLQVELAMVRSIARRRMNEWVVYYLGLH